MSKEPTTQQIDLACLSYLHDFGLLNEIEKNRVRYDAKIWFLAWHKVGLDFPVKPWAFLKDGKNPLETRDILHGFRVTCEVEWPLTDGNRVVYMQKTYWLPSWLEKGMKIRTDSMDVGQKVEHTKFNLERCEQIAHLTECYRDTSEELDETVSILQRDGWIIESEDECNSTNK